MPKRIALILATLAICWLAGCASVETGPRGAGTTAASEPGGGMGEDYSAEAIQRRTEAQARYAAGFLYDLQEEPQKAAEQYYESAMADPSDESLVSEASARLLRARQTDKALAVLKNAVSEPGASGLLYSQLGLAYALAGQKEQAIEANRTAVKKAPRSLAGYRHLAQLYFQDGKPEEGIKVLDQASRQPKADAAFLIELGELYLGFLKTASADTVKPRALEAFKRAAETDVTHPVLVEKLADGFVFLGELDAAVELYEKLLEKYPDLSGLREKMADLYVRKKAYAKAASQYEALIRLNPTSPQFYFLLGSVAAEEKKLDVAVDNFRRVMQLSSGFEPAYYELASAYLRLEQPTNALATLEKARSKFKPNFVCEMYTAMAYYGLKQYTNALRYLVAAEVVASANETNRLTHHFYFQLGATYERNRQYEDAARSFRRALALSPAHAETLNYLGYMWAERGENLEEARRMIEQAVELEPKNAAYLDSLGWVLFRQQKPREALPHLLKAIELSKEPDATLYDHLGDVYQALNEREKARQAWRKSLAVEANENREQIREKLESSTPASSGTSKARPQ